MKLFFIHLLSVLINLVEVAALACKKVDEYLDTKSYSCKKCLIGKLVLEREDKILNAIETLLNDKM